MPDGGGVLRGCRARRGAVASNEPLEGVKAEAMDGNRRKGARMARQDSQKPVDSISGLRGYRRNLSIAPPILSSASISCIFRRRLPPLSAGIGATGATGTISIRVGPPSGATPTGVLENFRA